MQENSGKQIRREIKGGQLKDNMGEKLGEKVVEKTGDKMGDSLGEIHKLNLCLWGEKSLYKRVVCYKL